MIKSQKLHSVLKLYRLGLNVYDKRIFDVLVVIIVIFVQSNVAIFARGKDLYLN